MATVDGRGVLLRALFVALLLPAVIAAYVLVRDRHAPQPQAGVAPVVRLARPAPSLLLESVRADPAVFRSLVEAARSYFDPQEEPWIVRRAFLAALEQHAAQGRAFLKDPQALRWLVQQSRAFEPQFDHRRWQKDAGVVESRGLGRTLSWVRTFDLALTYSIPDSYAKARALRDRYPRAEPSPLLVTMHDACDDARQRYAGKALLDRRFPSATWRPLYEEWLILAPTAEGGAFVGPGGAVDPGVFQGALAEFWRHYHVDFDRIVLDGSEQAFAAATSLPVFFAGIVFQHGDEGPWQLAGDEQRQAVRNFAPVPVYVVDNPTLARELRAAGHPDVTAGDGEATLLEWLSRRRRAWPLAFAWTAGTYAQVLAHWVNLDTIAEDAARREVTVAVDTLENRIRIEAVGGIHTLSLFLNDEIVDLDRPVRVEINGHVEHDARLLSGDARMQALGRDLDLLFDREPVRIRKSMYGGWLMPARIVQLRVRPPARAAPAAAAVARASIGERLQAERLLFKARLFAARGNPERAQHYLRRILRMPPSPSSAAARALLDELEKR